MTLTPEGNQEGLSQEQGLFHAEIEDRGKKSFQRKERNML
jgi:hypothetical protein